jgi:peptidoglycan/xylan/chitin deacetylase (PgdA/CDA1 family)/SAM-dependent methyltransferase
MAVTTQATRAASERPDATPQPSRAEEETARGQHWENFFRSAEDPWQYDNLYETTKYEQSLELLPEGPIASALELACAEGHFTARLARHVDRLIATDISPTALGRARSRCTTLPNVEFRVLDFVSDPLPPNLDLLVCSEALYYVQPDQLPGLAEKFAATLKPGGRLLMAHACTIADERDQTGFDWGAHFGAKTIVDIFGSYPALALLKELRTPLYRIQLFERRAPESGPPPPPAILEASPATSLPAHVERAVIWGGAALTRIEAQRQERAVDIPILMYHSIADDGSPELAKFRVSPVRFREQLRFLRRWGYHSVSLCEWASSVASGAPLLGRPVIITFDDGYRDFITNAAPLLEAANFHATIFVVTAKVGATADWDITSGPPLPLLDWDDLRELQHRGFEIGSHTSSHTDLRTLSEDEIVRDCRETRATLREQLGRDATAIAFPWGWTDPRIRIALARGGYHTAVISGGGRSSLNDDPLRLPRIEITGDDNIDAFARRLEAKLEAPSGEEAQSPTAREEYLELAMLRKRVQAYEEHAEATQGRLKAAEAESHAERIRAEAAERGANDQSGRADAAEHQLRESVLRLQAIESSTSWRASALLRSRFSTHPRLARLARRSAKLLWWSLTLQLPRKLRERLRHRRATLADTAEAIIGRPAEPPIGASNLAAQPRPGPADFPGNTAPPPTFATVAASLLADMPVFVCSFNNVTYVRGMLAQLRARGLNNLIVVDNASSVAEMHEYLQSIASTTKVVRLAENRGPRDIYLSESAYRQMPDLFCLTDPDLELSPDLPGDFLAELADLTERFEVGKAGFALEISDHAAMRDELFEIDGASYTIWDWEEQFWRQEIGTTSGGDPVYRAAIDTTFAVYNKRYFSRESQYEAIRVAGRYTCRHLPWYKENGMTRSEAETYATTQKFSHYLQSVIGVPRQQRAEGREQPPLLQRV